MYQGNIAIAKNIKTGEYTYIQKLKGEKSAYIYYDILNHKLIPAAQVADSEDEITHTKNLLVVKEITLISIIEKINYENALPINIDEYMKKIDFEKVEAIKKVAAMNKADYKNQIQNLIEKIGEQEHIISEVNKAIESNDLSQFYHSYVYAYHPNDCSQREYCWEDKQDLDLLPGEEIEVDTCYGTKKAIVTRVEKSIDKRNNIKEVIGRV